MVAPNKQVYYAHSLKIYNTKREKKKLRYLKKKNFKIFNPKTELQWDSMTKMQPYFEAVQSSCLIIASEYKKYIGRGVFDEIKIALYNKIPVYCLKRKFFKFKLIKIKDIKYIGIDWKNHYGKLILNSEHYSN